MKCRKTLLKFVKVELTAIFCAEHSKILIVRLVIHLNLKGMSASDLSNRKNVGHIVLLLYFSRPYPMSYPEWSHESKTTDKSFLSMSYSQDADRKFVFRKSRVRLTIKQNDFSSTCDLRSLLPTADNS